MKLLDRSMLSGLYARFILLAITILIVSISAYVTVMLTKTFYDSIGKGASVSLSLWLLASLGLLKAAEIFIEQLQRYTEKWISSQLNLRMENQLLTLLKPLVVTQIETPAFQNELHKVRSQFNSLSGIYISSLHFIQQLLLFVTYVLTMISISIYLPFFVMLYSLPIFIHEIRKPVHTFQFFEKTNELMRTRYILFDLILKPAFQKELILHRCREFLIDKWGKFAKEGIRQDLRFDRKIAITQAIVRCAGPAGQLLLQMYLIVRVIDGHMTLGDFMAMTMASSQLQSSIFGLSAYGGQLKNIAIVKGHFADFMTRFPFVSNTEQRRNLGEPVLRLSLNGLSFTYPGHRMALHNIHFQLERGESVAIVGENGSGKSTLCKLLIGLHQTNPGEFLINGLDFRLIAPESVQQEMAYVAQDFTCLPLSLHENITFTDLASGTEWMDYMRQHYPALLPEKLKADTILGFEFTGSVALSGGEWQRIALARALYKNAPFLFLDEATSAIDPESEARLAEELLAERRGMTTLFVTHRLSICTRVDRVVVMHDGTIVESGSHEELLNLHGKYRDMYDSQFQVREAELVDAV